MSEPFVKDQAHRERIEKGEAILPSYPVTKELVDAALRHADGLTALLAKSDWKPGRAHIEQARNSIKKLADMLGTAQAPTVGVLHDIYITMRHARTFITSREKMHPTGVELWDKLFAQIEALQLSSVTSTHQLSPTPEEIAHAESLRGQDLYAWPIGCHSPNSCRRNGRCMYIGCGEMMIMKWPAEFRVILWEAVAAIATQRADSARAVSAQKEPS